MQKDIHYYLTYALARKAGIDAEIALKIAWANQFTDECTDAGRYGLQTQLKLEPAGNWRDPTIQHLVLMPFHFIPPENPGDPTERPESWAVTEANKISQLTVIEACKSQVAFRMGIALHALQDTFSHQGFTGYKHDFNSRWGWDNPMAAIMPNIGHADMGKVPDISCLTWTDPKTFESIDNRTRAIRCAKRTFMWLAFFGGSPVDQTEDKDSPWSLIEPALERIFIIANYDEREKQLMEFGNLEYRFSAWDHPARGQTEWTTGFIKAARCHLALVMESL